MDYLVRAVKLGVASIVIETRTAHPVCYVTDNAMLLIIDGPNFQDLKISPRLCFQLRNTVCIQLDISTQVRYAFVYGESPFSKSKVLVRLTHTPC